MKMRQKTRWRIFFVLLILLVTFISSAQQATALGLNTYYVRTQSDSAAWAGKPDHLIYTDLQAAIDEAAQNEPAEVRVAPGVYKHNDSPFSLRNGVRVIGECAQNTVLTSADEYVFYHSNTAGLDKSAVLESVTITSGGMFNDECSPTLINCRFIANSGLYGGALYNHFADPVLRDCLFENNSGASGGAVYNDNASPELLQCVFTGNTAQNDGGAILNKQSSPNITGCEFRKNSTLSGDGGAIFNDEASAPIMTDVRFIENISAHYGGAMANNKSRPNIANATFMHNQALYGGGIYNTGSRLVLTNASLSANKANEGGGIYTDHSSSRVLLANCDFIRNNSLKNGGAISVYASNVSIANTKFSENAAAVGGAIANDGGHCHVLGSLFTGNYAKNIGGAVMSRSSNSSDSRLEIINATITKNTTGALGQGADVYCNDYATQIGNSIIGSLAYENTPELSYNIIGEDNEIATGDAQLFTNAFSAFCKEISYDKGLSAYDLAGARRVEGSIDIGAFSAEETKEAWLPPAPQINAVSNQLPYSSGSKTNGIVEITVSAYIRDLNNFPLIPKIGYVAMAAYMDDGKGPKAIGGRINSHTSSEYSFWMSLDDTLHSEKTHFITNINTSKPVLQSYMFDGQTSAANVPVQTRKIAAFFDRNIRGAADACVFISNSAGLEDSIGGLEVRGNQINITIPEEFLDYGETYYVTVDGYKDAYNNIMEEFTFCFVTEPWDGLQEATITGILPDRTCLPSRGGALTLTVTGGELELAEDIVVFNGMTRYTAAVVPHENMAKTEILYLPENSGRDDKVYTFTVYLNGQETEHQCIVTVEKPIAKINAQPPPQEAQAIPASGPSSPIKMGTYEIIVNGMPYTLEGIQPNRHVLRINSVDGVASVILPYTVLEELAQKNDHFTLAIHSAWGIYELPVSITDAIPNFEKILSDNGLAAKDIAFKITIADGWGEGELINWMPQAQAIGNPVSFGVEMIHNSKIIGTVKSLEKCVVKMLPLPKGQGLPEYAGVFFVDAQKGPRFTSYNVVTLNAETFLTLSSYDNGIYLIAENNVKYDDIEGHWAQRYIEKAASLRLVQEASCFEPDKSISRGEFTHLLSTALGLGPQENKYPYADVNPTAWYYEPIMRAKSAGLLRGFSTINFKPDAAITREEMASLLAAALYHDRIRSQVVFVEEPPVLEAKFKDYNDINIHYLSDVLQVTEKMIMAGSEDNMFAPKSKATRAEAVASLMKFLGAN